MRVEWTNLGQGRKERLLVGGQLQLAARGWTEPPAELTALCRSLMISD